MPVLPHREDLLKKRLNRFTRMLPGVARGDVQAVHQTRVASRRLREVLPVLQLDGETTHKLGRRLRRLTRRLGQLRELDVLLLVIEALHQSGRHSARALSRVASQIQHDREQLREKLTDVVSPDKLQRVARKLESAGRRLEKTENSRDRRAWRWAVDARVAHRADALENAIDEAGAVYLQERLHNVRIALKKFRYALELAIEAGGESSNDDLKRLKRVQGLLGRMHDLQILIDRVRHVQASLQPPNLALWNELDGLVTSRRAVPGAARAVCASTDAPHGNLPAPVGYRLAHAPEGRRLMEVDPYELYLIRHGIAEERGDEWPDDTKRPLTGEGVARLRKATRGLIKLGVRIDVVLTSPLVRARQTAEVVAGGFESRPPIVVVDSLVPGASYQALLADLEKQSKKLRIALVGHEPGMGELAAKLSGSRHPFEFKKGGMCRIDVDTIPPAGPGTLRWFVTPRILRELRK